MSSGWAPDDHSHPDANPDPIPDPDSGWRRPDADSPSSPTQPSAPGLFPPPTAAPSARSAPPVPTLPPVVRADTPTANPDHIGGPVDAPLETVVEPIERSPRRWLVGAAALTAVAVLVGSLMLVTRAGSDKGGAASPEEAGEALFTALENEDIVALAELLHPGERRTLAEPAFEIVDELVRLEVLDGSLDLSGVNGVDITIENLAYHVAPIDGADDLRELIVDSATMTFTSQSAELPIGATLRKHFGDELAELDASDTDTVSAADSSPDTVRGPILVEYDGRWYLSLWYSVAEEGRRASGSMPVPSLTEIPLATGAESPEAAIDAAIQEAAALDVAGLIGMFDPEEAGALYRYAPLFLDDALAEVNSLLDDASARELTWSVTDIRSTTAADGDVATVSIEAFTASVTSPDLAVVVRYTTTGIEVSADVDGEHYEVAIALAGDTITMTGNFAGSIATGEVVIGDESVTGWVDIDGDRSEGTFAYDANQECAVLTLTIDGETDSECFPVPGLGGQDPLTDLLGVETDLRLPAPQFVTTRHDGLWYFSPSLTVSNAILMVLRSMDAASLDAQIEQLKATFEQA